MLSTQMVRRVLRDDAVTRGLGDMEARLIVEWLADRAEHLAATRPEAEAWAGLSRVSRLARVVARFVRLWADPESRGAAAQLATAERMGWPLPAGDADADLLTADILAWLDRRDELAVMAC
jgi:hypothetical protein